MLSYRFIADRMRKPTVSQLLPLSFKNRNVGFRLTNFKGRGGVEPPRTVPHVPQNHSYFIKLGWTVPDTDPSVRQQRSTGWGGVASVIGDDPDGNGQPSQHHVERAVLGLPPLGGRPVALQELQQVQNRRPPVLRPPSLAPGWSRLPPRRRGRSLRAAPRSGLWGRGFTSL